MNVLVYARAHNEAWYRAFCQAAFPTAKITVLSDYRRVDETGLVDGFYRRLDERQGRIHWPDWVSADDELDIVARSVVLRKLPLDLARSLAGCMACTIDEIVERVKPDVVLGMSLDTYVLDLFHRAAVARDLPWFFMMASNINENTWASARGELLEFREPAEEEIDAALNRMLDKAYLPTYTSEWLRDFSSKGAVRLAARERIKKAIFPILARRERDPYGHNFLAHIHSPITIKGSAIDPGKAFDPDWERKLKAWKGPKIYVPFQAYPECSIDYFPELRELIDYPSLLREAVRVLDASGEFLILAKEHPGMLGLRMPGFVTSFQGFRNCVLVPPTVNSNHLLSESDAVVLWTGTVGIEAAIRGKPVITVGDPYYRAGDAFSFINKRTEMETLPDVVRQALGRQISPETGRAVVRKLLAGAFPGEHRPYFYTPDNATVTAEIATTATFVRENYDRLAEVSRAEGRRLRQ